MPQIDPLVFGVAVFVLVAATIIIPRRGGRYNGPTADDVFVESLPSRYESRIVVPDPGQETAARPAAGSHSAAPGAPRAVAPTRQAAPRLPGQSVAPPSAGLEPLRLPVE
jgi:hypothetical protein